MNDSLPFPPSNIVDPIEYVTDAWLAFLRDPDHGFVPLRDEIKAMLYRFPRPLNLGGFFDGFFEHLVQEATWLVLSRLLAGNRKLISATQAKDRPGVNAHLMRSIYLSLQMTMWRTRSLITRCTPATAPEAREQQVLEHLRQAIAELGLRPGS